MEQKRCGSCDKTDGLCYASLPPKVKCTITGEYRLYDDTCNVKSNPSSRIEQKNPNMCLCEARP